MNDTTRADAIVALGWPQEKPDKPYDAETEELVKWAKGRLAEAERARKGRAA